MQNAIKIILLCIFMPVMVYAQMRTVNGTVTDIKCVLSDACPIGFSQEETIKAI